MVYGLQQGVAARAAPERAAQTIASSRIGASGAPLDDQAGAGGVRQSRYNGVVWHEWNNRWEARIRDDKKLRFLGYYTSEEDAARAHDMSVHRQQPQNLADLNFPQEPMNPRAGDYHQHLQKGTSQFRGVSWNSISEKWRAQLCHGDEVHHLKLHESEVEAAHAYDRLAIKLKKDGAVTNFPAKDYEEYYEYVLKDKRGVSGHFKSLDGGASSEALGASCNNGMVRQSITRSMALSDFAAPITRARTGGLLEGKEAAEQELAAQALASLSSTCTAFDISPPSDNQQMMSHSTLMRQGTPDVMQAPMQPTPSPYQDSTAGEAPSAQDLQDVQAHRQGAPKSSRFKGVSWHKHSQKWYAYIQHSGKMHGLGYFHDQLEAAAAYDAEAKRVHRSKAVLNFPGRRGGQEAAPRGNSRENSRCQSVALPSAARPPPAQPGQGIKWNPSDKKFHVYVWRQGEVVSIGGYDSKSAAARALDVNMHAQKSSFQTCSQTSAFEPVQPYGSTFARSSATTSPFHGYGQPSPAVSGAVTQQSLPTLETACSVKSPLKPLPSAEQALDGIDEAVVTVEVKSKREDMALRSQGGGHHVRGRRHPTKPGDAGHAETESDDSSAGLVQNMAPLSKAAAHLQIGVPTARTRSATLQAPAPALSAGEALPLGEVAPAIPKPSGRKRARSSASSGQEENVAPKREEGPRLQYRGSSKFKGVSWSERSGKWRAQMWSGNKVHHLRFFDDEEAAARCYDAVVVKLRGPSAATNFACLEPSAVALADDILKTITTAPLPKVTTKYRGVRWHYCNRKWEARIFDGTRQVSLGYFDDELEAAQAYDAQAILKAKAKGGNALVNFPDAASGPQRSAGAAKEQKPPIQPKRRATASLDTRGSESDGSEPPPRAWGVKRRRDGLKP